MSRRKGTSSKSGILVHAPELKPEGDAPHINVRGTRPRRTDERSAPCADPAPVRTIPTNPHADHGCNLVRNAECTGHRSCSVDDPCGRRACEDVRWTERKLDRKLSGKLYDTPARWPPDAHARRESYLAGAPEPRCHTNRKEREADSIAHAQLESRVIAERTPERDRCPQQRRRLRAARRGHDTTELHRRRRRP